MPITEQWQEDVKQYGKDAYLMWEFDSFGDVNTFDWNMTVLNAPHSTRKESAALPFDLAAAKAGDEVETTNKRSVFIVNYHHTTHGAWVKDGDIGFYAEYDSLRMKHPRRAGVDYSKFEESENERTN